MDRRAFLKALGIGIVSAGCAAPAASPTTAPPTAAPKPAEPKPAATTAAPKPAATTAAPKPTEPPAKPAATTAPAKPKDVIKLRIVQSSPGLSFAPVYLANAKNLWAEEGLEIDWQVLQGGALTIAAVVSGEAQFMASASSDPISSWEKNIPLFTVAAVSSSITMSIAARKDWMQSKGVTPQSSLKDRVAAMKGARFGVATVAGGPTQYAKFFVRTESNLDPEKDVEFLVVGQGAARIAALRQGQVDLFIGGIPDAEVAESEGIGSIYIDLGRDAPVFRDFTYEVLTTTKEYTEKNPEPTRRAARAIARANNLIQSDLAGAIAALKQAMPEINPQVVDLAMKNSQKAFGKDALMTQTGWKNAIEPLVAAAAIKQAPPTAEGEIWTNKFLK